MADPVTIVVVTYNSAALLPDFFASLEAGLAGLTWDLLVVDNASTDGTVEVARHMAPTASVLERGTNGGYAAGINAGLATMLGQRSVLIVNPDVRLLPGCVAELSEALELPGVGIAVPRLINGEGELILSMRREPSLLRMLGDTVGGGRRSGRFARFGEVVARVEDYNAPQVVDWAEGSTLLISASCWRTCGPWDESYFLYSEETDFLLRAKDAGFACRYVPSARAIHLQGGSSTNPASWALLTVNRVRLYRRRHGKASAAAFYGTLLTREVSRTLLGRATARAAVAELVRLPRALRESGETILERRRR